MFYAQSTGGYRRAKHILSEHNTVLTEPGTRHSSVNVNEVYRIRIHATLALLDFGVKQSYGEIMKHIDIKYIIGISTHHIRDRNSVL